MILLTILRAKGLTIMHKRIFNLAIFAIAFCTHHASCQMIDLNGTMHKRIDRTYFVDPEGKELEKIKEDFSGYTKEQLATALIADLDVDRGSDSKNRARNFSAAKLYRALELPPIYVCKELEKEDSPQRKARLMEVLWGLNTPETTKALVDQIKDHRPAEDYIGVPEEPVEPLRVCDIACNTLVHNLINGYRRISFGSSYDNRDKAIERTLRELKLDAPQ